MSLLPTFLWKLPPKKPKFNDVTCVLFKHSTFCCRMLEMHYWRPRFQTFSREVTCTFGTCKSRPMVQVFSFSTYSKSFAPYLTPYLKTLQVVSESSYLQSRLLFHYRVRIKCVNGKLHKYRT